MAVAKKETKKVASTEATRAVTETKVSLPAIAGASDRVLQALEEVRGNMDAIDQTRLPRAKVTEEGFQLSEDADPVEELEGVLIHAMKRNVYYDKVYNASDVTPPTCFSNDGVKPDKSIEKPVHLTCKGCPMSEFGTNAMKSGKACRNLKPLFLLRKSEDGFSIIPRQITITPTSLKAANTYLMDLTERGLSYRKVLTKLTASKKDKNDRYAVLSLKMVSRLDPQDAADADAIRTQWLPVMDSQVADSRDLDKDAAPDTVAASSGEY